MITFHHLGHCVANKVCRRRAANLPHFCRPPAGFIATLAALAGLALLTLQVEETSPDTQRHAIKAS